MEEKEKIIVRLRRIEGQVRGLERMIEEESSCEEILTQVMAARSALEQAALLVISRYMDQCLPELLSSGDDKQIQSKLQRVLELMLRMH